MTDLKKSSNTGSKIPWLKTILGTGLLVIITTISLYAYKFGFGLWEKPDQWGMLGDFFGGVLNPLLGFLSLIFLLITLSQNQKALSQNKDALNQNEKALKINSEELALTREEVSGSRNALEQQAKILEKQNFEGTFFQLLSLYNEIISTMEITNTVNSKIKYTGRDSIEYLTTIARGKIFYIQSKNPNNNIKNNMNNGYLAFYEIFQGDVGHYFRIIYNIVKFVDSSELKNKKLYTNLLRAQLSTDELKLLFYNCLSSEGKKFKPLIEKYGLLKFLPLEIKDDFFIFKGEEIKLYKNTAFN